MKKFVLWAGAAYGVLLAVTAADLFAAALGVVILFCSAVLLKSQVNENPK